MESVMNSINNFFEVSFEEGQYSIENDAVLVTGQYYKGQFVRIVDSIFNDGVYKVIKVSEGKIKLDKELTDETFKGYIVGLAVPKNFIDIVEKINEYDKSNKGVASESIPNYSITYDTTYKSGIEKYAKDLRRYRKPYTGKYGWMKSLQ